MHAWDKSEGTGKTKIGSIFSVVTLLIALGALVLALKRPQPVAPPMTPASLAANAQSYQDKVEKLGQSQTQGQSGTEVRLTASEIAAAIAQAPAMVPAVQPQLTTSGQGNSSVDPDAAMGAGSADQAILGEPIVSFEGDVVHGQFVTEIAGKSVVVTVSGHLGAKDGYATFDPTEFKVGELSVPVSLVNDSLQKKLLEQRDRLKLPDSVSDVRVENGELVLKQK
jgi:hypothetical protein